MVTVYSFHIITVFDVIYDAPVYQTHPNLSRENQEENEALILKVIK